MLSTEDVHYVVNGIKSISFVRNFSMGVHVTRPTSLPNDVTTP